MAEERVIRISRPIRSPLKPYTTGETIHGTVHFTSPRTIPFRQVRVWLVGAARTTTIAAMPAGTQTWLILLMREPMACGQWFPMPGESFRAFVKYTMDFSYTIPERIHDACCYGNCTSADDVAERHGRLPPSMGYWHLNDMSPRVAEIIWCISAEEIRESPGSHPTWTMTVQAPIKILPFSPEEPPRLIEPDDSRYKLSRTKKLKENLLPFSRSIGTLKATTSQPPAIMIDPETFDSLPSCALIDLLFSPAKRPGAPPKIQSVKIEIQACTFYSSRPMHCVPDLGTVQPALGTACIPSEYTTTRTIVTVFPDAPEWKCNQCGQFWRERSPPVSLPPRRPPRSYRTGPTELQPSRQAVVVVGTNQMPQAQGQQQRPTPRLTPYAPPEHLCENGSYEAQLKMLFGVNNHIRTLFLPSFFSCSIARTYTLKLTLNAGPRNRKIKLSVPLQIGVRGIGPYPPGMPQPPFVPNGSFLRHTGLLPADVYSAEPDPPSPERSSLGAASDSSPEASNPESSSSDPSKAGAASPEVSAVDVESP